MSTPIQPVPDVILAPEFPTLADRPAGTYNAKAAAWANGENAMSVRNREIALTAKNNAESAKDSATTAQAAATAAVGAAGATEWEPGKLYALGDAVWSPIDLQTYRRRSAGSSTTDPSLDPANWARVGGTVTEDDLWASTLAL